MGRDGTGTAVLTGLAAHPGARHPLDLARELGGARRAGALYERLHRLHRDGLVTARVGERGRVGYALTGAGAAVWARTATPARPPARGRGCWPVAVLAAAWAVHRALARPRPGRLPDLDVYVGAVRTLARGGGLYDFAGAGGAPFTYPPFAALLMRPIAGVPLVPLQLAWTGGTVASVLLLAHLVGTHAPVPPAAPGPPRAPVPLVATALLLSAPVSSNLWFGQLSVPLAALVAVDLLALSGTRWHGAVTGLAAAVKLTPLVFVPVLWCAGRRRAAATAAGVFTGCGLLGAALLPAESARYWGDTVARVERLGPIASVGNQSLHGLALRSGMAGGWGGALVAAATVAVAAAGTARAAGAARRGDRFAAAVVAGATGLLVSPVSWTHHQVWLVLAGWLPVPGRAWRTAVLAVMLLPVTALPPPLWSNARVLLAVVVAVAVPLAGPSRLQPSILGCHGGCDHPKNNEELRRPTTISGSSAAD